VPVEHNRSHPDLHQPWSQWAEDQTLHFVLVYNNPFRWESRRRLFNDCARHFLNCPNVRLYRIELAYGDRPCEVTDPSQNANDIQLRTSCEMWHKENLINLAVQRFPSDYRYGGYLDGDFHFTRHDWALETIQLLQHHPFVQNFSTYADLTAEPPSSWDGHRPYRLNSSFAWNFCHQDLFLQSRLEAEKQDPGYFKRAMPSKAFPFGYWPGAPGGSWSWTREGFNAVGGLLDTCILGSGDYHMAVGLARLPDAHAEMGLGLQEYTNLITQWQQRARLLTLNRGNIGCVDNFAVHHWHGNKRRRGYGDRPAILKGRKFNPLRDISRDWQGVWQWSGTNPLLREDVRRYFLTRDEDSTELLDGNGKPLV